MPDWLNFLDFMFLVVLVLSGIFAYIRGFTKEVFAISSWFIAAFLVKFLFPVLEPFVISGFGEASIWSSTVTYSVSFFLCIVVISFLANKLSKKVHTSDLKNIDKTLGILFGLLRGIFIMAIFYIAVLWFVSDPAKKPSWMRTEAKCTPVINYSVNLVSKLFPESEDFNRIQNILDGKDEGFNLNKAVNNAVGGSGVSPNITFKNAGGGVEISPGFTLDKDADDFDVIFSNITEGTTYTEEETKNLEEYLRKIDELEKIEEDFLK